MKIAIVCDVLGSENNGTSIAGMNLIRHLKSKGHQVRVLCPDKDKAGTEGFYIMPVFNAGPFNGYVEKNGVSIARTDKEKLEKALRGADAIHVMMPFFLGAAAVRYARDNEIPVTAGFHCQAENITNHFFLMDKKAVNDLTYKIMYNRVYKYVDAIHYPTQFIRDTFEKRVGRTTGYVISNGVNEIFIKGEPKRPKALKDKFVILYTGRYSKEKNHKILIDAVSLMPERNRIQLIFAGSGPLYEDLKKYGEKLPNKPIMEFYSREELVDVINYSDLYVHTAKAEIESIGCLEAISCGLVPVISDSPRSATRYFALSRKNIFDHKDPADLAAKILYWMEHEDEKDRCSKAYREYGKRFDQKRCMEQMEEMIINTAGRAGGSYT